MEHIIYMSTVTASAIFVYVVCRGIYLWTDRN